MADIHGTCAARFEAVRSALARNLDSGEELGASLVVDIDGEISVDLWGGFCDQARAVPWSEHTITNVWSSTKTVTSLAALMLADRGKLDVDAPVAAYWPEFAASGKRGVLVRHLMSHSSGVSGLDQPAVVEDLYDWHKATSRMAGPGAVVGAGHRVGLSRAQLRAPGRRTGAADQRHAAEAVRRRGDRRAARRRFPDRRRRRRLGADRRRGPAAAAAVRPGSARPGQPGRQDADRPARPSGGRQYARTGGWPTSARRTGTETPVRWPGSCRWSRAAARLAEFACCARKRSA